MGIGRTLSPLYRVCTKAMCTWKNSYWYGEHKNVISLLVQKPHGSVRAWKPPRLMQLWIGPTIEICGDSGNSIAMVQCLHQSNVYMKRKLRVLTAQKYNFLNGAKTIPISTGLQTTPFDAALNRAENGNLRKLGQLYHHYNVFAPKQCAHQKEVTDMESTKM